MYNICKCVINYLLFAAVWLCLIFTNGIVNAQVNQVVNDGSNTAPVIFPPTDCVYKWLNDNTSIGLAAKGTGNIASFTTINKGYAPAVANITARVVSYAYQTIGTTTYAIDLIDYSQAGVISVPSASLQGTSPDGSVVYFAKGTDNRTLYKVDGKNNTLLATIPVRDGFYNGSLINGVKGLLFSLDGSKIYTYSAQAKAVIVINTVTNAVERLINLNPAITTYNGLMLMSPDATLIYIMGGSLSTPNQSVLNIVSTVTNTIVSTVNLGQGQGRMFLTTDGTKLFINSTAAGPSSVLTQYDTATGDISNVPIPNGMSFSTISPDGKKIYLTQDTKVEYGYPIHILDVKTGNVTPANLGFTYVVAGYGFSPNGEVIHFRELATGTIKVVSTKTDVVIATIKQSPVVGINVIDQQTLTNYDGSKMYVTTYAGVNNTEKRKYLQVIDYKTYTVTDSIPLPVDGGPIVPTKAPYPCAGSAINFSITVNPPPLVIAVTGTLTNVDAVYGTPGITTSFTLSGTNLPTGVIVTPPAGYEVSTDDITYSSTLTVGLPGTIVPTKVYVRLKLTSRVGNYSGNIVLSSGTANAIVATVLSKVTPAPLLITAGITKKYGEVLNDVARSTVFTAIGLKNNETIGGITIHYSAGAAATDAVGIYTGAVTTSAAATGTFSAANYAISYPQSDVIVEGALLTITADDKERNYGEANPVLTFKYNGFVNNESAAQLTTLPLITTAAVPASPVGQYPITIGGAIAANYAITYVPATLTVTSTTVTVATAFTPNGDGINDTWEIKYIGQFPNCTVEVMNRYGYKVFNSIGYPIAWDGRINGANLPTGTYYYIIKLTGNIKPLTGYLAIIR